MRRSSKTAPFFLVVRDDDAKQFMVAGPMIDDRAWNDAVWEAQKAGRHVRSCSGGPDRDSAIRWETQQGLTLCDDVVYLTLDWAT
jgi:hypothetical protein